MAVGFVASASSGSQASVASFNIGTLGTGARAGIVFVCIHNSATDIISGVTWNGVAMTRLFSAIDTNTEPGVTIAFFLDNVTNGIITVSRTNNAVVTVGYAASISAAKATEVTQVKTVGGGGTVQTNADASEAGTAASGEQSLDDGSPGTNSMRFAAAFTGAATPLGAGTNSTSLQSLDSTALGSSFVRETTAGQGSRSVGFATGTTDDYAAVFVAVSEAATKTLTLGTIDASRALYAPTVTPKNTLTIGVIDASRAIYAPTLVAKNTLTLGTIDASRALYAPSMAGGPQTLTIPVLDASRAIYAPTITPKNTLTIPLLEAGGGQTLIINVPDAGADGNYPPGGTGTEKHYNNPAIAYGPPAATVPGAVLSGRTGYGDNGAYGDGSGGRWYIYTGPTSDQLNAVLLADTGMKSGNFGSAYYGGTVPAGHNYAWFAYSDNIWYDDAFMYQTLPAHLVYAPTLTPKNTFTLGLLDASRALYAPTVVLVAPPQSITLGLLDASRAIYAPTLTTTNTFALPAIDANRALYAPAVLADQRITVPLLDAARALYAPSLAAKNTLTLGLLDASRALYAPALTPKNGITLGTIDASRALYAPMLTVGAVTITLSLLDASRALYQLQVVQQGGPQPVDVPLLDANRALYAPTLVPGAVTITISTIDAGRAVYAPTVILGAATLALPLLDAGRATYAPSLKGIATITLDLLDGSRETYAPVINPGAVTIGLALLAASQALYAPIILGGAGTEKAGVSGRDREVRVVTGTEHGIVETSGGAGVVRVTGGDS